MSAFLSGTSRGRLTQLGLCQPQRFLHCLHRRPLICHSSMLQFRTLDNLGFHMVAMVISREMTHGLEEFIANATASVKTASTLYGKSSY